jgi:putative hydrolase of the HAD superfamily
MEDFISVIRRHQQQLEPLPTNTPAELRPIPEIRAVLFDVYGTMLISGSGEVGTVAAPPGAAIEAALTEMGVVPKCDGNCLADLLVTTIQAFHALAKKQGIEYPEVNIVQVWRDVLEAAVSRQWLGREAADLDCERMAIEYEMRANPVGVMPGLVESLAELARSGVKLGVISNAQFFTLPIFPALTKKTVVELGFDPKLLFLSYEHGRAKPGLELFRLAGDLLESRGIGPGEVIYIGNDMLNDVMPAWRVGFRTALFAGDARSLRLREGDPRVSGVRPDMIVTNLQQFVNCLVN